MSLPEALAWPPKKEDLEKFYNVEKLSAAKIAKVYGLRYKNPKVAESTILYQLKKNGIGRRDPAEHLRKVTEQMVDEWVGRYQGGESLKQIAGHLVSPVTVWIHLKDRGMALRGKEEAQIQAVTKHLKVPFSGGRIERAYLMGLRYGDLYVVPHGRAIRVKLSTTHPAMADLFVNLFSPYGNVRRYPKETAFTGYEWNFECDLDMSFQFLLVKPRIQELMMFTRKEFLAFMAGFFDAEGSILFHKKKKWGAFELAIANMDKGILEFIGGKLAHYGRASTLQERKQNENRGVKRGQDHIWRLEVYRAHDVQEILRLLPLRHAEKRAKREIARLLQPMSDPVDLRETMRKWKTVMDQIDVDRKSFILEAKEEMSRRRMGKVRKAGEA